LISIPQGTTDKKNYDKKYEMSVFKYHVFKRKKKNNRAALPIHIASRYSLFCKQQGVHFENRLSVSTETRILNQNMDPTLILCRKEEI
jgi:hypothetical protein